MWHQRAETSRKKNKAAVIIDEYYHFSTADHVMKASQHCCEEQEEKAHSVSTHAKKKRKEASLCDIPLRKALKALLYKKCTGWIETVAAWGTRCQCEESCLWGSLYQRSSYSSFQSSDKACKHILLYRPQEPQQIRTDLLRYPLRYCRKYNNRSAPKMVFRFSCKVKHLHTHSNS